MCICNDMSCPVHEGFEQCGQQTPQGDLYCELCGAVHAHGKDANICTLCGHNLTNNAHGFDQNDAEMDGDVLIHCGKCTYCKECSPVLGRI